MAELYSMHRLSLTAPGEPLFAALAVALPGLSRHLARQAVTAGLVSVDGTKILEAKHPLGDASVRIECDLRHGVKAPFRARIHDEVAPAEKPFTIIYQDSSLVVINKAAGILSAPPNQGGDGLPPLRGHVPELLRRALRKQGHAVRFIGVVHRLDKDTSGCLCLALTREAQRLLSVQFATHAAARTYRCLVSRAPRNEHDTITSSLGHGRDGRRTVVDDDQPGKEAVTHYRVLRRFTHGGELEVRLETGRTHQIRVHLSSIGCPVYGDHVYNIARSNSFQAAPLPKPPRLMLHAHLLAFDHPVDGKRIEVVSPIPQAFPEFSKLLQ